MLIPSSKRLGIFLKIMIMFISIHIIAIVAAFGQTGDFIEQVVSKLRSQKDRCGELRIAVGPAIFEDGLTELSASDSRILRSIVNEGSDLANANPDAIRREIIAGLAAYDDIDVLDRTRLDAALDEISIFRTGDRQAFINPDKLAELHKMVNAEYLMFPRLSLIYHILERDHVDDMAIPSAFSRDINAEADVICVETGVTVAYIKAPQHYDYSPSFQISIKEIIPDVEREEQIYVEWRGQPQYQWRNIPGYLIKLNISANNYYGRKFQCGIFAIEPDGSTVSSKMDKYCLNVNNEKKLTSQLTIGPAEYVNESWDKIELWIPYDAFNTTKYYPKQNRLMPTPFSIRNRVDFHFVVYVWEIKNGVTNPEASAVYNDYVNYWIGVR